MRNNLIPAVALVMIGFTVPASAADIAYVQEPVTEIYTRAGPLPLQAAVDIANGIGLVSVSNTNGATSGRSRAMTLPEAIWKSMSMRAPARS